MRIITKKNGLSYRVRNKEELSRIFTPNEWNKFFNSLKDFQKPLFDCLINTGGRISEVLNIKIKDVDFDKGTIYFRFVKRRTRYSDGNNRTIPISSQFLTRLNKYSKDLGEEDYLFLDNSKLPKDYDNLNNYEKKKYIVSKVVSYNRVLKSRLKKQGVKDWRSFSLHNIRKTTECWLNFLGHNHLLLLLHFGHDQSTALKHYLNINIYNSLYKFKARQILGDLYI